MDKFWQMPIVTSDLTAIQDKEVISEEKQKQWLITVNHEAKKYNTPEAIPDTHKLQEVWAVTFAGPAEEDLREILRLFPKRLHIRDGVEATGWPTKESKTSNSDGT